MIVQATINLKGLAAGQLAEIPDEPSQYVLDCLSAQYLIPFETQLEEEEPGDVD